MNKKLCLLCVSSVLMITACGAQKSSSDVSKTTSVPSSTESLLPSSENPTTSSELPVASSELPTSSVEPSTSSELPTSSEEEKGAELEKDTYSYDKAVGGDFILPIIFNDAELSMIKINEERIPSGKAVAGENRITISEDYVIALNLGDYNCVVVTTLGSLPFTLKIVNSIETHFDDVTEKTASIGRDTKVHFDVDFDGTTVKSISFGDYVLNEADYEVTQDGIAIKNTFFERTHNLDERVYTLVLSNNDSYNFKIKTNIIAFTDYDVTTLHDELQDNLGHNPYYQDSTVVEIINAPEGSGMSGKVLKYTPHTTDTTYDTHGIYTFAPLSDASSWAKVPLVNNKQYMVSFDYITYDTTAGEDYRFRSWTGGIMSEPLNTGEPGVLHHFSQVFNWTDANAGIMVFGKFLNGGYILYDNYRLVEIEDVPTITIDGEYHGEGDFTFTADTKGYIIKGVLIDGKSVNYTVDGTTYTIAQSIVSALEYGQHELALETYLVNGVAKFVYSTLEVCELTETSKTFDVKDASIKLAGNFSDNLTIVSATRTGTSELDAASVAPVEINKDYFELCSDGLQVKTGLLKQIYGTEKIDVTVSNGSVLSFNLISNQYYFCNFDETSLWNPNVFCEDTNTSVVNNITGFDGNVLRICDNDATIHKGDWFTRFFFFYVNNASPYGAHLLTDNAVENVTISFDLLVDMKGTTFTQSLNGLYYITHGSNAETPVSSVVSNYNDGNLHHFSLTLSTNDFEYFALAFDPREYNFEPICYIDNFSICKA